jgi:hypothetical protein
MAKKFQEAIYRWERERISTWSVMAMILIAIFSKKCLLNFLFKNGLYFTRNSTRKMHSNLSQK